MKKRFITYRKYNFKFIKIISYLLFIIIGFVISIKFLFSYYKNNIDENKVNHLLAVGSNNLIGKISILDIANLKLTKPETLLSMSFGNVSEIKPVKAQKKDSAVKSNLVFNKPIVYIYNTHQTEEYNAGSLNNYNITPTVYMAANILQKKLKNFNIDSIVEDENMIDVLHKNNWNYNDSYKASMLWLERAKKEHNSLKYFIDLHRDSNSGTVKINDVPYAKMMFVIGMNHEEYEKNEELVLKLNDYLNKNYEGLMRNIFYGKRSQYNQHFDSNCFLIEVGGPDNNIEEVYNSVGALAEAISHVIGDI